MLIDFDPFTGEELYPVGMTLFEKIIFVVALIGIAAAAFIAWWVL